MKLKDLNKVAQFEKAIEKKYGELTVKNPKSFWDDKKERKKCTNQASYTPNQHCNCNSEFSAEMF